MFYYFHRIFSGINTCKSIEQSHPDKVSDHNNDDDLQEDRQLFRNGSFIRKTAEGAGNENWKDWDNNTGNNFQNDFLEFLQKLCSSFCLGPGNCKANQNREHQCTHNAHDLRNFQSKDNFWKFF